MAYATTEQLERRWRALSPNERTQAETLLEDASAIIDTYNPKADDAILSIVCTNLVRRAMSPDAYALNQEDVPGIGWQTSEPVSAMEPTWKERDMMRGREQSISSVLIG